MSRTRSTPAQHGLAGWQVLLSLAVMFAGIAPSDSCAQSTQQITVGSKRFTESVILGEVAVQLCESEGFECRHQASLGGTALAWAALLSGELDIYPDYTGTIRFETLALENIDSREELVRSLAERGIEMSAPLGFNNTYVLGMRKKRAVELGIEKISDLNGHPDLAFGFGNEFLERADGLPQLRRRYGLVHTNIRGIDHDLAYRALVAGDIDVMDLYSTDAEIPYYDLAILQDDLNHFPQYDAVYLFRSELREQAPSFVAAIASLGGTIDEATMQALNRRAKIDKEAERTVAADFLREQHQVETNARAETTSEKLWRTTRQHLWLVGASMLLAAVLAVPLGVLCAKRARLGHGVLAIVGIFQTVPSLALLVFMIPLFGVGEQPAIAALFLYSLLPIVRNTYTGLVNIPPSIQESAEALGLTPAAKLIDVELPMASPSILAGLKIAVVVNTGTATLGGFIGAGGYGESIFAGIQRDDIGQILLGAIPAAVLAILAQGAFELLERWIVPRGLRLAAAR